MKGDIVLDIVLDTYQHMICGNFRIVSDWKMNKLLLFPLIVAPVLAISPTLAFGKSEVAGGYDTGFVRGVEEARAAINESDTG